MTPIEYEGRRIEFASAGSGVDLRPHCVFHRPEAIRLGSRVIVSEFAFLHGGLGLVIGSFVHVATHASVTGGGFCLLEDFVGVAAGARLITGTDLVRGEGLSGPTIPAEFRAVRRSFVHLGRFVFLGTNVVVHPGVTIGEGAVVGSGSVVTRDLEPWTIHLGAPARAVGRRDGSRCCTSRRRPTARAGASRWTPRPTCT